MRRHLLTLTAAGIIGAFLASDARACHMKKKCKPACPPTCVVAQPCPATACAPAPCAPKRHFKMPKFSMPKLCHKKPACPPIACATPAYYAAPSPQASSQAYASGQ